VEAAGSIDLLKGREEFRVSLANQSSSLSSTRAEAAVISTLFAWAQAKA